MINLKVQSHLIFLVEFDRFGLCLASVVFGSFCWSGFVVFVFLGYVWSDWVIF